MTSMEFDSLDYVRPLWPKWQPVLPDCYYFLIIILIIAMMTFRPKL